MDEYDQQEQQQAHVWVRNQKVRMMDIPPQIALRASQAIRAAGATPTQANVAWWLKRGRPMQ